MTRTQASQDEIDAAVQKAAETDRIFEEAQRSLVRVRTFLTNEQLERLHRATTGYIFAPVAGGNPVPGASRTAAQQRRNYLATVKSLALITGRTQTELLETTADLRQSYRAAVRNYREATGKKEPTP